MFHHAFSRKENSLFLLICRLSNTNAPFSLSLNTLHSSLPATITEHRSMALTEFGNNRTIAEVLGASPVGIIYSSIQRWWNGEISGKRCAKNVVDATVIGGLTSFGGVAGGAGGAALGGIVGTLVVPVDMVGYKVEI